MEFYRKPAKEKKDLVVFLLSRKHLAPVVLLVFVAISIFVIEIVIMHSFSFFPFLPEKIKIWIDPTILTILIFPVFYFSLFRPLFFYINRHVKSENLKEGVIRIVSHELKNPLWIARENIKLITSKMYGDIKKDQEEILSSVESSVNDMIRLTENLLDISKLESGEVPIEKEMVDLVGLISKAITFFEPRAKEKNIELRKNFSSLEIMVFGDKGKLSEVFNNLIGNALKFTQEGIIEVSVTEKDGVAECSVSDTGRGIAKEDLSRLFNKFSQVGKRLDGEEKGFGLGLAIVKEIVDLHKGSIWVESELEKGTKIFFSLPKYSSTILLKEYIDRLIKESRNKKSYFSICKFEIESFGVAQDQTFSFFSECEQMIKNHLRSKTDTIIRDGDVIFVLLADSNKADALYLTARLQNVLSEQLARHNLQESIKIKTSVVSFPEDGKTQKDLLPDCS